MTQPQIRKMPSMVCVKRTGPELFTGERKDVRDQSRELVRGTPGVYSLLDCIAWPPGYVPDPDCMRDARPKG